MQYLLIFTCIIFNLKKHIHVNIVQYITFTSENIFKKVSKKQKKIKTSRKTIKIVLKLI